MKGMDSHKLQCGLLLFKDTIRNLYQNIRYKNVREA